MHPKTTYLQQTPTRWSQQKILRSNAVELAPEINLRVEHHRKGRLGDMKRQLDNIQTKNEINPLFSTKEELQQLLK